MERIYLFNSFIQDPFITKIIEIILSHSKGNKLSSENSRNKKGRISLGSLPLMRNYKWEASNTEAATATITYHHG
jgi:hypothetical protein